MDPKAQKKNLVLGWREWMSLKELNVNKIKVKVDTGARTSALHATDLKFFKKGSREYVEFKVHPIQKNSNLCRTCHALVVDKRKITSSSGVSSIRPVIETELTINNLSWPIELTLVNRDIMGFRMLLGRQAIRGNFLVDPGRSYILTKQKSTKISSRSKIKRRGN